MNKKTTCMLVLFALLLSATLLCLTGYAEINWTTEAPEGPCLTRTQYSWRQKDADGWSDWSGWSDMYAFSIGNSFEARTRTLYASREGLIMMGSSERITMLKGTGAQMAFQLDDFPDPYINLSWRSTNKSVASVDQTGYVSAHQAGTATIELFYQENSEYKVLMAVEVNVIPRNGLLFPAGARTVGEQAFYGDSAVSMVDLRGTRISAIGAKAFAENPALRLVVGDGGTINVDDSAFDGSKQVTFAVTALGELYRYANAHGYPCYLLGKEEPAVFVPVSRLSVNFDSFRLKVGESERIYVGVVPRYADNQTLAYRFYSIGAPDVVSVDNNGIITGLRAGTAVITISSTDGSDIQKTVTVTVDPVRVTGITLNQTSLTMNNGEEAWLSATVSPSNASNKKLDWYSSNTAIATVESSGKVVARGAGTAVVRATATDGSGVEATCTVTVNSYGNQAQYTSIWSSDVTTNSAKITARVQLPAGQNPPSFGYYLGTSPSALYKGETESSSGLTYTIENIFYTCGNLTPSTTYYYRFFMNYDGHEYLSNIGSFTTSAVPASVSISGTYKECYVNVNQDISLPYTVSPSGASVSWSSSNSSLCSVDQSGKIYPRGKGAVTITAIASANGTTATYSWTVHII